MLNFINLFFIIKTSKHIHITSKKFNKIQFCSINSSKRPQIQKNGSHHACEKKTASSLRVNEYLKGYKETPITRFYWEKNWF